MADIPESPRVRPELAVFHNLPVGGGINVAGALLRQLEHFFSITVHHPEGSSCLNIPGSISIKEWPFRGGGRICGLRKLAAPLSLPARLRAFDRLCSKIAAEINSTSDIVLVHNSMFLAAPPVLKYLTVPSIYFCYEFPRHIYEKELIRRTRNGFSRLLLAPLRALERIKDREAVMNADGIVTFSSWMKNRIIDIYGLESSIVRPGVDTDFFHIEKNAVRRNMILSIGALWPFKGHEMAMDVVSRIPPDKRPALTVIADREYPGYGADLERKASELGIDLCLEKEISNEELRRFYSICKASLCCQHNEPYGLIPLEAMACGLPVIAVREGGFIDNINSGKNGILVNRDPAEMASVLEKVLLNDELRNNLILKGRKFVTEERSMKEAGNRLAEILSGIIKRAVRAESSDE
ncbi:MAG: glycosyltransferase family 4 protein [Candidatus Aegiribacteria sp.]|nr:glycosyltransferase family 4 protein [Candidatus Aegiribacteria sp.]